MYLSARHSAAHLFLVLGRLSQNNCHRSEAPTIDGNNKRKNVSPFVLLWEALHFPHAVIYLETSVIVLCAQCRNACEPLPFVHMYGIVEMDIGLLAQRKTDLFLSSF